MPNHVDVTDFVRCYGAAAIKLRGKLQHVSLGFECLAGIVHPRIEHGGSIVRAPRPGHTRTHPRHVDASALTNGNLCSAHAADSHGAAGHAIDTNWLRKLCRPQRFADIVDVTSVWVALEVDQMQVALLIHRHLRLDATVWSSQQGDLIADRARVSGAHGGNSYEN